MYLFEKFLEENSNIFKNGDKLVLAFSSGPDSVFLLDMLIRLKSIMDIEIIICHLNHMYRGKEAYEDEQFARDIASKNNFKFFLRRVDLEKLKKGNKKSLEEIGRNERYNFFNDVLNECGANYILTAHNLDDQIETFLFRLIRGSSLEGLEGIKGDGKIQRPISNFYKKDILKYLHLNNIAYRIDKTNEKDDYTRNSIRLNLIPFIEKEYNIIRVIQVKEITGLTRRGSNY